MDILFKIAVYAFLCNVNLDTITPNKIQPIVEHQYSESKFQASDSTESFKDFCIFFFSNYSNQITRVKFPIKDILISYDNPDKYDTLYLSKKQWTFFDLKKANWKSRLVSHSRFERLVNFRVFDTGVYLNCKFRLIEGKWYLVEIFNQSI